MQQIIRHIKKYRAKDLSAFSDSFLKKSIDQRILETFSNNLAGYFSFINSTPNEIDKLLDSLHISYSLFFRNPVDFSIIERYIFPGLIQKSSVSGKSIRIWSTACAEGQEAYSIAMLADDLLQNYYGNIRTMILATDISELVLTKARKGEFPACAIKNVKFSFINKYFENKGNTFLISDHIRGNVEFNHYDLLDSNTSSPPSGIFGGYDVVICSNLLIYYKPEIQKTILKKLYNSISAGGYLLVDESEKSIVKFFDGFRLYSLLGNIFVKN